MSDVTVYIFNPELLYLCDPAQVQRKEIRKQLVEIWLKRGFFRPEKAKIGNLWLQFVDATSKMVDDENGVRPDLAVVSESTIGSGLFNPGMTTDIKLIEKFEQEAGDDIAIMFRGLVTEFWNKLVIGKFGEHVAPTKS